MPPDSDKMWEAIANAVRDLSAGEVVSYGEIAARAGYPRRHRAVGQLLKISVDALPWWRVVYADGRLPPCNPGLQEERLVDEGVQLQRLKVIKSPKGCFAKQR
ncbi:MAG: MGMT family protein [Planctomycetota bacterium]